MAGELAKTGRGGQVARGRKSAALTAPAKKVAAKHGAKHAAKKHAKKAAKHVGHEPFAKHAAKKHAAKYTAKQLAGKLLSWSRPELDDDDAAMGMAFHHMQRAGAVISLLEPDSGGDLKALLEHGIDLYRSASGPHGQGRGAQCASGLLRAAEHLGMAGLYSARREHRVEAPVPSRAEIAHHLDTLDGRLANVSAEERSQRERLKEIARELLRRAEGAGDDPHLQYELTMAADGICSALEAGL